MQYSTVDRTSEIGSPQYFRTCHTRLRQCMVRAVLYCTVLRAFSHFHAMYRSFPYICTLHVSCGPPYRAENYPTPVICMYAGSQNCLLVLVPLACIVLFSGFSAIRRARTDQIPWIFFTRQKGEGRSTSQNQLSSKSGPVRIRALQHALFS